MRVPCLVALSPLLLLVACGAPTTRPAAGFTPATRAPAGNGSLIGLDARAVLRQYGQPRLDIRDPTARKLQYSGERCVLDIYLYPPAESREPVVSYIEARTAEGNPVDAGMCSRALRQQAR